MNNILVVGNYKFEIVKSIPKGYSIWNIGNNMVDGYLPLCQVEPSTYSIIPETLKAVKFEKAQTILRAICGGADTIKKMEKYLLKNKNNRQTRLIKEALPLMKQLEWEE